MALVPLKQQSYGVDPQLQALLEQQGGGEAQVPQQGPLPTDPFGLTQMFEGAPSYMPMSSIPQIQDPEGLQGMMGGQGFDPSVIAQMRAQMMQDTSNAALPQLGAVRRGLSSAGQLNSPAGAAMQAIIGRNTADAQTAGNRSIDINNAAMGQQNKQFGLGLAHQTAMQNANMLFQGLSQNAAESGTNFRTGLTTAFGQNPFQPAQGRPQESGIAPALTGAAQQIGQMGTPQQQQQPKPAPQQPAVWSTGE